MIFLSKNYNELHVHAFPSYYMYVAISNSCSGEQNLTHTHARPKHINLRVETHLLIERGKEYQITNIVIDEYIGHGFVNLFVKCTFGHHRYGNLSPSYQNL